VAGSYGLWLFRYRLEECSFNGSLRGRKLEPCVKFFNITHSWIDDIWYCQGEENKIWMNIYKEWWRIIKIRWDDGHTVRVKAGEHQDLSREYKCARCLGQDTTLLLHLIDMAPTPSVSLTLYFSNILIYTNKFRHFKPMVPCIIIHIKQESN